jgi:hypothetical protein
LVDRLVDWCYNRDKLESKVILKCKNPRSDAKRVVAKGYEASLETRPKLNELGVTNSGRLSS